MLEDLLSLEADAVGAVDDEDEEDDPAATFLAFTWTSMVPDSVDVEAVVVVEVVEADEVSLSSSSSQSSSSSSSSSSSASVYAQRGPSVRAALRMPDACRDERTAILLIILVLLLLAVLLVVIAGRGGRASRPRRARRVVRVRGSGLSVDSSALLTVVRKVECDVALADDWGQATGLTSAPPPTCRQALSHINSRPTMGAVPAFMMGTAP